VTFEELDKLIIARVEKEWRKVAFIVASVGQASDVPYDDIAARIAVLVQAGQLEARGDISKWRNSEIRLR